MKEKIKLILRSFSFDLMFYCICIASGFLLVPYALFSMWMVYKWLNS